MEAPRFVFAFGPNQNSYFVGCGDEMEWNDLPSELESVLVDRASSVIAVSLGEKDAFHCRYISRLDGRSHTAMGNLPSNLSFLLSSWFADPQELPHIAFAPGGGFFFQSSALAAWENLPRRLDGLLNELRESRGVAVPARSLAIGENGSFVFVTGADGEIPVWNDIDAELAHRLSGDCELNTVESTALSLASREDYLIAFSDGSIFYSVPDTLVPVVQRFVRMYHLALQTQEHARLCLDESRPASPRAEMAATMAGLLEERRDDKFSLALPDGILGWDEDVISRFIEDAVGSCSSENTTPTSSEPRETTHPPSSHHHHHHSRRRARPALPPKKPLNALLPMRGRASGTDYAASWVESQGMLCFDPSGIPIHGMVIEL